MSEIVFLFDQHPFLYQPKIILTATVKAILVLQLQQQQQQQQQY
jgi:hypothetical protein